MCLAAIYWARCAAIFYGNTAVDAADAGFDDDMLYEEMTRPHPARRVPIRAMLPDEAIASFKAWKAHEARVHY